MVQGLTAKLKVLMVVVVLAVVVISGRAAMQNLGGSQQRIGSYKQCVEDGDHISSGVPRTCTTKDGKKFIDDSADAYQVIRPASSAD